MKRSINDKFHPDRLEKALLSRLSKQRAAAPRAESASLARASRGGSIIPVHIPDAGKPRIRINEEGRLSRFVIRLETPELERTETVLASIAAPNLLLETHAEEPSAEKMALVVRTDLAVRAEDVATQLTEDLARVAPVKTKRPSTRKKEAALFAVAPALPSPFTHASFGPRVLPAETAPAENLPFALDLPEAEEEEQEAELVTLADLDRSVQEMDPEPTFSLPTFHLSWLFPNGWQRSLAGFVALSFVFVLPIHAMNVVSELRTTRASLTNASGSAISAMKAGAAAAAGRDAEGAASAFGQAGRDLEHAQQSLARLDTTSKLLLNVLPQTAKTYRQGQTLIHVGDNLADAGRLLAEGADAAVGGFETSPATRLATFLAYAKKAEPLVKEASRASTSLDSSAFPEDAQEVVRALQEELPGAHAALEEFISFGDMAHLILGGEGAQRYLLVFQNNTELRPTGGFMGSFAELTLENGVITRLNVPGGGTYDLQGSLKEFVAAPEPLRLLSARWEFQDANWFADFPTSARQIMDFYASAGGGTVDGVVAVNATYVADLLNILGDVDLPAYGKTMTSENFVFEAQNIAEVEYDRAENQPKAFLGDLAPALLARATSADPTTFLKLLDAGNDGLESRDLQVYFSDNALEERILDLGWGGAILQTPGDYLMLIDTNLGGGKTDAVINETVDVSVDIAKDGTITNTVTVSRAHQGVPGTQFTGVNNVDYLRLYVPKGSKLLDASGFSPPSDILFETPEEGWKIDDDLLYTSEEASVHAPSGTDLYEENGKAVFGNWVQTRPGTTAVTTFRYELPFKLTDLGASKSLLEQAKAFIGLPETARYTLLVQKQSGVLDRTTNMHVSTPEGLVTVWASQDLSATSFANTRDGMLTALFERVSDRAP